jgi:hypothetical protein
MARVNATAGNGNGSTADFVLLPTDIYRMKVIKSVYGENQFGEPDKNGKKPMQIVLTWEVTTLTEEQADAMTEAEQDWDTATVPQYLNPFYGDVRAGGPSKFKAFVDKLQEQGYLEGFDPGDFDSDIFLGIEQRVNIQCYTKTQGDYAGKLGNKVIDVLPLKVAKKRRPAVAAGVVEEELPF